jgi:hypothetical protein
MAQITWDDFVKQMAKVTHYLKKEDEECALCRSHANLRKPVPCGQCNASMNGECYVIIDRLPFNPFDGKGLDVVCTTHGHKMNVPCEYGDWNVKPPKKCPVGEAKESGKLN